MSIVIPTLNEAAYIERTVENVHAQDVPLEIIVADGRSTDGTRARVDGQARVVEAPRGRAFQMNAGARAASGDVLLFLHADTLLPTCALTAVRETLCDPSAEAGIFRLAFDHDTPLLRLYGLCTRLPWSRLCFGDRALFVRRSVFEEIGGFPEWPLFEDLELADRLVRRGGFRFLPLAVTTSARRFDDEGVLRQQLRNAFLWGHYLAGTDPHRLAHLYPY